MRCCIVQDDFLDMATASFESAYSVDETACFQGGNDFQVDGSGRMAGEQCHPSLDGGSLDLHGDRTKHVGSNDLKGRTRRVESVVGKRRHPLLLRPSSESLARDAVMENGLDRAIEAGNPKASAYFISRLVHRGMLKRLVSLID